MLEQCCTASVKTASLCPTGQSNRLSVGKTLAKHSQFYNSQASHQHWKILMAQCLYVAVAILNKAADLHCNDYDKVQGYLRLSDI